MTRHTCIRCGYESHRATWPHEHPFLTVAAGLFTLVFLSMLLSVYALAGWSVIVVCAAMLAWNRLDRERERRAALAARADYEHRALMAQPRRSASVVPITRPIRNRRSA